MKSSWNCSAPVRENHDVCQASRSLIGRGSIVFPIANQAPLSHTAGGGSGSLPPVHCHRLWPKPGSEPYASDRIFEGENEDEHEQRRRADLPEVAVDDLCVASLIIRPTTGRLDPRAEGSSARPRTSMAAIKSSEKLMNIRCSVLGSTWRSRIVKRENLMAFAACTYPAPEFERRRG